jgi:peptidoglycan L-alanyl-D-glutamate endopeptidase CwlK
MRVVKLGSRGQDVLNLQCALAAAGVYSGDFDGCFGAATQNAVIAFQKQSGLLADGVVDAATASALHMEDTPQPECKLTSLTAQQVAPMFPAAPIENIQANLPYVLNALCDAGLRDRQMVLMALATIRTETETFLPISEYPSPFNTSPGGQPFDKYDHRADLGNQGPPDGANFRGRGFVQLTGRANFQKHGQAIGLETQLLTKPTLAHQSETAAKLLASFLKAHEPQLRTALQQNNLMEARRIVNGGLNGYPQFEQAYQTGAKVIPENI